MSVKVRRVPFEAEHENQKWLVLEGSIEGKPALTKRVTINTAALADGSVKVDDVVQKLTADVLEYEARLAAVEKVIADLGV